MTEDNLAERLKIDVNDLIYEKVEGRDVVIFQLDSPAQLREALEDTPEIKNYILVNDIEMIEPRMEQGRQTVKVRQCPIEMDIRELIITNRLEGWKGSMFPQRIGSKRTTAILNAPSEEEVDRLLRKGYLVRNGKILAVVPSNSTLEKEDARTLLIVGVNKVSEAYKKLSCKLTELTLQKILTQANYPVQSVKLVELERGKIGHSAYVLMRERGDMQDFQPFKEITSEIILKWTVTANYKKICDKCLSWTEHEQTCSRHASNLHKFATARDTSGVWDRGAIIRNRFKRSKD